MKSSPVSAVLFVKNLRRVADFYCKALAFDRTHGDEQHSVLRCRGFELIVHQIPDEASEKDAVERPPERRVWSAIRLNFPVRDAQDCRRLARNFGGHIDDAPPAWADPKSNVFLGYDPEGNVFKISEHPDIN